MEFEQKASREQAWVDRVFQKLSAKMPHGVAKAREVDFMPYTTKDGAWKPGNSITWWTNGFWPASMWQMFLATKEPLYREEAERAEAMMDEAFRRFEDLHHDVGFQWKISSGARYAIDGNPESLRRLLLAANLLAGRYNPNGFLRAWNGDRTGWSIIVTMMNLPLLYWASKHTGDPRFRMIAMRHADHTLQHFLRPDGSVHHIVIFDPETDAVLDTPYGQGYASGSSWSRGQAWALYGFTLSFLHTGKPEYLEAAKRVAHYFIANVCEDWIPDCDFRAPKAPRVKDNCAGGIASCGLLELSKVVPEFERDLYFNAAIQMLKAMDAHCADWTKKDPAIFTECTGAYHSVESRHITMNYGDYFFIEAMNKLRGESTQFWM